MPTYVHLLVYTYKHQVTNCLMFLVKYTSQLKDGWQVLSSDPEEGVISVED